METNLGQRLARFAALLGLLFVIATAALVSQRLSQDALALTIGLACGIGAMAPTILLAVMLWRRAERSALQASAQASASAPQSFTPPVIVVAPPALPMQGGDPYRASAYPAAWMPAANPERKFTIVGEE